MPKCSVLYVNLDLGYFFQKGLKLFQWLPGKGLLVPGVLGGFVCGCLSQSESWLEDSG